jgi:predicted nucleotidyltransferase/DNA-directed RNA polymerase subunit F
MIYSHQQKAIDYITKKLETDPQIKALLISGSIAHGFNDEKSDVDMNIIVSNDLYEHKVDTKNLAYWESAADFYEEGYFDGRYITIDFLDKAAKRGNEPTRFSLQDSIIAFDKTGQVAGYIEKIGIYDEEQVQNNTLRFLSQFEAWKWFCNEALRKQNEYLLETAVSRFILYSGRLILLDNRMFFPYHKWFIKALEIAPKKPQEFMNAIFKLLKCKSEENINALYEIIRDYKNWANGIIFDWPSYNLFDVIDRWLRGEEYIENI